MEFNLVQLTISVSTSDPTRLARWLPTVGPLFSAACRARVCQHPQRSCVSCPDRGGCPWHEVFGQELATDPAELRRHQKPPLPFVFSFPFDDGPAGCERVLKCGLVVTGNAIAHIDILLNSFAGLLDSPPCPVPAEVVSIGCCDYQGAVHPLEEQKRNLVVMSASGLLEKHTWGVSELSIRLMSPLRLSDGARLYNIFEFSRFARSVMRRVSSLAYYYSACEYDADFKALSSQADEVVCTEDRFWYRSDRGQRMSGIGGSGRFRGDFSRLMPFLVLGEYLHVGKGSAYGMGMYELTSGG